MNTTINLLLYRDNDLVPKTVNINRENYHEIKILLMNEISKLKHRFLILKEQGIIKKLNGKPKIMNSDHFKEVKYLINSRTSLKRSVKILNNFR